MIKRMIIMLVATGIIFGGIFGYKAYSGMMMGKMMASRGIPLQTVSTITAGYQPWQPSLKAVGTVTAMRGADLSPEIAGIVSAIHFNQGEEVKAGDLLLELDAGSDLARLHSLAAAAALAKTTFQRDQAQLKVHAISQQQLDTDEANLKQALANVAEQQAQVDRKMIRAPFDGKLGIRKVDLGQYLSAGTVIVTLQSLDPIYLDFRLPQQALASIEVGQKVLATTDAWPEQTFPGTIEVIEPQIDPLTRNVTVRARLDNREKRLLPGMYASVNINTAAPQQLITLPQSSIAYNPYGNLVFVVEQGASDKQGKPMLIAKQIFVTTGNTRGDQVAILNGVKEGDQVVTAGQIKLRNGSPVAINNSIQPANSPDPKVSEK
ncbi:efflux RND transporter periplasmic adaptor subunit [Mariprofundus erugo]|uniref:Efflux RND transporter periplasmic adaptor subunit n=1 Tax=Mariprofundus erugo TaxID=2528639 RepID=A0A5R9GW49_9PROT|nr:efflux RND transporter periplasmic adaptor subunit [Mariprofundus erugo]TLS68297.1 efflux RND transporter periplasmic adaptor subunit [Mariprofundus erugo]TLS77152.1 efflux RND transporter periplasmic adaptor subunit [Mariprofundus erugo]